MDIMKKIFISQPAPLIERNPFSQMADRHGAIIEFEQLIAIEGLSGTEFRQQLINPLDYTAVILTSKLACDHYFRMLEELRLKVQESMHYYCISEAVSNYLTKFIQYRKRKVFAAENNDLLTLAPIMARKNETYLMVVSDIHQDTTIERMAAEGYEVQPAVMYRTVSREWPKERAFDYDIVALNTAAAVRSLNQNFPDWKPSEKTVLVCFGKATQEAAEQLGWEMVRKAPSPEFPSLVSAIEDYLEKN